MTAPTILARIRAARAELGPAPLRPDLSIPEQQEGAHPPEP